MLKAAAFNPSQPMVQEYTDSSGTPGNATIDTPRGRVSFAALAATVTITNSLINANSTVLTSLRTTDATATDIRSVAQGAGSVVITANAAATSSGTAIVDFVVVN